MDGLWDDGLGVGCLGISNTDYDLHGKWKVIGNSIRRHKKKLWGLLPINYQCAGSLSAGLHLAVS